MEFMLDRTGNLALIRLWECEASHAGGFNDILWVPPNRWATGQWNSEAGRYHLHPMAGGLPLLEITRSEVVVLCSTWGWIYPDKILRDLHAAAPGPRVRSPNRLDVDELTETAWRILRALHALGATGADKAKSRHEFSQGTDFGNPDSKNMRIRSIHWFAMDSSRRAKTRAHGLRLKGRKR
jgi:hypothetical protein